MTDNDQLSMFEGEEIIANALNVTGTIKDPLVQPIEEFALGQRVVLLIGADTHYVGFSDGDLGRVRDQKVKATEAYAITDAILDDAVDAGVTTVADLFTMLRVKQEQAIEKRMELRPAEGAKAVTLDADKLDALRAVRDGYDKAGVG